MANRTRRRAEAWEKEIRENFIKERLKEAEKQKRSRTKFVLNIELPRTIELTDEIEKAIENIDQKARTSSIRPLEFWNPPKNRRAKVVIGHLVRYLFAEYPVPQFMDHAWYSGNKTHQAWFLHMGTGHNLRNRMDVPMKMTKKMSHHFLQAPSGLNIKEALRWAQVRGYGGDKNLARAFIGTRLGNDFSNDSFWEKVVIFFARQIMLDTACVNPIVDFIYGQKYQTQEQYINRWQRVTVPPPNPGFDLKGRTIDSLLRLTEAWHLELRQSRRYGAVVQWEGSQISDFEYEEGTGKNKRIYTISQLVNSRELMDEGRAMHHCVASYVGSCMSGRSSIWSVKLIEGFEKPVRLVTVEVNSRNQIVQIRGKCNALPLAKTQQIIRRWATKEGLNIRSM